ncbi:MAG: GNAT family N-acetyltransferase [Candidatus Korarchaeum sp.]
MGEGEEGGAGDLVTFRDLGPGEIDEYVDFDAPMSWVFLTEEERESLGYEEYLRIHRELIRSLYESNIRNRIIAAYIGGSIVGVVWIGMRLDTVHYVPVCYVYDIEVKEEFRGRGLGSKLLQMAEETCREWGLEELMLSVEATNSEALSWYERRGYGVKRLLLSKRV